MAKKNAEVKKADVVKESKFAYEVLRFQKIQQILSIYCVPYWAKNL